MGVMDQAAVRRGGCVPEFRDRTSSSQARGGVVFGRGRILLRDLRAPARGFDHAEPTPRSESHAEALRTLSEGGSRFLRELRGSA